MEQIIKGNLSNLKKVLYINALFSTSSGLIFILFYEFLSQFIGLEQPLILLCIGAGLILFALNIVFQASKEQPDLKQVKGIIIQDWLWVFGSFILIIFPPFPITKMGYFLIINVAVIVSVLAFLQGRFLRSL